jgi:hypothetical protein
MRRVEYSERLRERMTTVFFARSRLGADGGGEAGGGSTERAEALGRARTAAFLDGTFLAGM